MVFRYAAAETDAATAGKLESEMATLSGLMGQLSGDREQIAASADRAAGLAHSLAGALNRRSYDQAFTLHKKLLELGEKSPELYYNAGLIAHQKFVRLGERRGDLVAVVSGLKTGETVVSSGAFKLRNGAAVVVRNDLAPKIEVAPTVVEQ